MAVDVSSKILYNLQTIMLVCLLYNSKAVNSDYLQMKL